MARTLNAQDGGTVAAARLVAGMGTDDANSARGLAYRLYDICERKSRADEAHVWNMLAREWPAIEAEAQRFEADLMRKHWSSTFGAVDERRAAIPVPQYAVRNLALHQLLK